jgi:Di-glucose binding within endoplasmic reticulum.
MHAKKLPSKGAGQLEELVRRVAESETFEKSPRLRAFFLHVCRCALEDKSEEATEQQIGIFVYGRQPGYNPNEDNIVRSQARVLRMKLEHHFANEGRDEPYVILIPKGRYLPQFEPRVVAPTPRPEILVQPDLPPRKFPWNWVWIGTAALLFVAAIWGVYRLASVRTNTASSPSTATLPFPIDSQPVPNSAVPDIGGPRVALAPEAGVIRIAAGHTGASYLDVWGNRWGADRFFQGGVVQPGPKHFFPPVADEGLFKTIREAVSVDPMVPQPDRGFQYNIPLSPGVYELRLYFADPMRMADNNEKEDGQNRRHFSVDINGKTVLDSFDAIADGGNAAVDVRAFKDVEPASDGKLHLNFHSDWGERAFVSAIELSPGMKGRLMPIRIAARTSDFVDEAGVRWNGDRYFIGGRTWSYHPQNGPKASAIYLVERHGNFSYSIPVPPGSYTVRLHFMDTYFSPLIAAANCHGAGCRVFDVTCNGVLLLQDFDIVQSANGAFLPVVREFHGLRPNGQGKLQLAFSSKINYGEIRAIEVIDEAK